MSKNKQNLFSGMTKAEKKRIIEENQLITRKEVCEIFSAYSNQTVNEGLVQHLLPLSVSLYSLIEILIKNSVITEEELEKTIEEIKIRSKSSSNNAT